MRLEALLQPEGRRRPRLRRRLYRALEAAFVDASCASLARLRELQWEALQRVCSSRKEFYALLTAADSRERDVLDAQEAFNSMPIELRLSDGGKEELHMVVEQLQERLWAQSDEKRQAAEKRMGAIADDGWIAAHA